MMEAEKLKAKVAMILSGALSGADERYKNGPYIRWGVVQGDINAAIDAAALDVAGEHVALLESHVAALRDLKANIERGERYLQILRGNEDNVKIDPGMHPTAKHPELRQAIINLSDAAIVQALAEELHRGDAESDYALALGKRQAFMAGKIVSDMIQALP